MTPWKEYEKAKAFFLRANEEFVRSARNLFDMGVSEQCLCGGLMNQMNILNFAEKSYLGYYADVEYNRNSANAEKRYKKSIQDREGQVINITCDIILHSRGRYIQRDNILAVEMKKESKEEKYASDRNRLRSLTSPTYNGEAPGYIGIHLPIYVCRYALGVFYIISRDFKEVHLEYYKDGERIDEDTIILSDLWEG